MGLDVDASEGTRRDQITMRRIDISNIMIVRRFPSPERDA
jgi:hypothetical protein